MGALTKKNGGICQRPHCKQRSLWLISGMHNHRVWSLFVCAGHADIYRRIGDSRVTVEPVKTSWYQPGGIYRTGG